MTDMYFINKRSYRQIPFLISDTNIMFFAGIGKIGRVFYGISVEAMMMKTRQILIYFVSLISASTSVM